jgi:hypothetical protein
MYSDAYSTVNMDTWINIWIRILPLDIIPVISFTCIVTVGCNTVGYTHSPQRHVIYKMEQRKAVSKKQLNY